MVFSRIFEARISLEKLEEQRIEQSAKEASSLLQDGTRAKDAFDAINVMGPKWNVTISSAHGINMSPNVLALSPTGEILDPSTHFAKTANESILAIYRQIIYATTAEYPRIVANYGTPNEKFYRYSPEENAFISQ